MMTSRINYKCLSLLIALSFNSPTLLAQEADWFKKSGHYIWTDVKADVSNYLETDNLFLLGDAFLASGILANTGLDKSIRKSWQKNIKGSKSDSFFKGPQHIGGIVWKSFPIYLGAMILGEMSYGTKFSGPIFEWGYRSLRTGFIGVVQQASFTLILGSGRPINNATSNWQPFRHRTGVSGHSFYGAIPFLTAAHMTNPLPLRALLYGLSTLPGISRINSDAHYFSQVVMGWSIAFLSSASVYRTEVLRGDKKDDPIQFGFYPHKDGAMLVAKLKY
ncbi:MAG: superfamily protein [Francisellaceae bacterium]|nr:superfamily protein [Francisellaceae bacterium]